MTNMEKVEELREKRESAAGVEPADPRKGQAVETVTENVSHPADASSAPGPYEDLDVNRPGVSTNLPNMPIAHSLVAGAGASTGPPAYDPSNPNQMPDTAFVNDRDKAAGNVVELEADDDGNVTVPAPEMDVFAAGEVPKGKDEKAASRRGRPPKSESESS